MYLIDLNLMEMPKPFTVCPECTQGNGLIHLPNGTARQCDCTLRRNFKHLVNLPLLKSPSKLNKSLDMGGGWLIKAQQLPVGRLCIYDIHLRRFLLDRMRQNRNFKWSEVSPQEAINIAWYEGFPKLLTPDLLSIKMISWNFFAKGFDTLVSIIEQRSLLNRLTFLVCPQIKRELLFESNAMTDWYKAAMAAAQVIELKWEKEGVTRYDDTDILLPTQLAESSSLSPIQVAALSEKMTAENLADLHNPLKTPPWLLNVPKDDED